MCPWFYLWAGPGMLSPTPCLDIWWAAVTGHPSANSLHGWLSYHLEFVYGCSLRRCFQHSQWCLSHRLVLSTPFGILSYLLLWFVPGGLMSPAVTVLWFLIAACLFETLMSVSCKCYRHFSLLNQVWYTVVESTFTTGLHLTTVLRYSYVTSLYFHFSFQR